MPVIDFNPRLPAILDEYGTAEGRVRGFIQSAEGGRGDTQIPQKKREV
jgi:hypothetical protein